jgi:hypothetical protein
MECYTLNLDAQQMGNMGMNEKYIGLHRYFSAQLGNVTHLQGDSRAYDFSSIDRKFDLIFIDGDHRYEFVKNDTEQVFKHLFHENSIVVWHDYAYNPEKLRFEVLAGILDGCPAKFHGQLYYVANTMCAVYVNRDLDTHEFESPKTPEGAFEIKIDWKD